MFEKCVFIPPLSMGIFTRLLQGVQAVCILWGTDRPLQTDCHRRLVPSIRLPVSQFSGLVTLQGWEEGQALVVWLRAPHDWFLIVSQCCVTVSQWSSAYLLGSQLSPERPLPPVGVDL